MTPRRNYDWARIASPWGKSLGGVLRALHDDGTATIDLGGLPVRGTVEAALRRQDGAPSLLEANFIPRERHAP